MLGDVLLLFQYLHITCIRLHFHNQIINYIQDLEKKVVGLVVNTLKNYLISKL
jgi:hypothetical protein